MAKSLFDPVERRRRNAANQKIISRRAYLKNKVARKSQMKLWAKRNPEKVKAIHDKWYGNNRNAVCAKNRAKHAANPEIQASYDRKCRKGKEKQRTESHKKWVNANREYVNAHARNRYKTDENYRLRVCLRSRIREALATNSKCARTSELLGCTIDNLKIYLESKFLAGMTWQNRGTVWHIDHIIPCAVFDLSRPEHQRYCFHFSNLQPLFAPDNVSKGDKVPEGFVLSI